MKMSFFCREVVSLMSSAADFVRNIQPKKLLPPSGKLKREVSMEEIIQVRFLIHEAYPTQAVVITIFTLVVLMSVRLDFSKSRKTKQPSMFTVLPKLWVCPSGSWMTHMSCKICK